MKRLVLVPAVATLIAGMTFLLSASRSVDFELYDRSVDQVQRLDALNTALGETALQVRYGLLQNYDALVRIQAESQRLAGQLLEDHYPGDDPAIGARVAAIVEYLRGQEGWLHAFQSLNAVLANSSAYLPSLALSLSERPSTPEVASLQKLGTDLVVRLLRLDGSTSQDSARLIEDIIVRVESQRHEMDGVEEPVLDSLVHHARVLLRYTPRVDAAVSHLTDPTDNQLFGDLEADLRASYQWGLRVRARYRIALYGLSLLLLAAAGLLFVRLRIAHRGLQGKSQVIEHKQVELADANGRLHDTIEELQSTQAQLIDASRKSGMAEVATAVLHNVGNVLNSVNASAELLGTIIEGSKIGGVRRAADMFRQNEHQLATYLASDPQGKHLPAYLQALADAWDKERSAIGVELTRVRKNIDHIKVVVRRQQSHAKSSSAMVETLSFEKLVDDALAIAASPAAAPHLRVQREYASLSPVAIDRHRIFQVLLNLLTNACHAVAKRAPGEGLIIVRTMSGADGRLCFEVEDNGYGIAPEDLRKVFNHGFSTKTDGHGFGLHDSANAMTELGGQLSAHSDGPGKGARFRFELPIAIDAAYAEAS
jgi:two-component system, NtrC family, sensor kinase